MIFTKRSPQRTIFLNILAEFIGSAIYSCLFFIFFSRYLSPDFKTGDSLLSLDIAISFLVAIYIPFHTYRIHILPFVSILAALRKRQLRIIFHKIPAQLIGAFVGVAIFLFINEKTTNINFADFNTDKWPSWSTALLNGLVAGIICASFYIVRVFFKAKAITGTIVLSAIVGLLFYFTFNISDITAMNPFGWFIYDLVSRTDFYSMDLSSEFLIHIIAPISFAYGSYYLTRNMGKRKVKNIGKIDLNELGVRVDDKAVSNNKR